MAAVVKRTPRVRPRVSKNKKKNWNKYCDIKDVEDFLEEERFDERIGGSISLKKDEDLYFIQKEAEETKPVSNKDKQTLKCHSNIGAYSKVLPPLNQNLEPYSKRIKNRLLRSDVRRAKTVLANPRRVKKTAEDNILKNDLFAAELKDLWAVEKEIDPEIKDLVVFRDEYTRKRSPNVPRHRFQKPSLLPAIEKPGPGASYNPAFDDHQNLLREALVVEEKKQKEELHLKRVLTDMFPTRSEAPTQESILAEMSQGLFEEPDADDDKATSSCISRNPPVSYQDRLPKSRKRKRRERKESDRLKRVEKLQKKRLNEVFRVRSIKSEIKKDDMITKERIAKKMQRKIDQMYKPKTLSKHKYEAPDLEVKLSEELCESLRTLSAEGNLLEDRYKSLQRRNLIEPRIVQKRKRKYKLKKQIKRSHRNFT